MTSASPLSVLIIGGGIVGLCVATFAKRAGYKVRVIDSGGRGASSVAAGMIAPALEALNEPDPVLSFERLKTAQAAWDDLKDLPLPGFVTRSLFLPDDSATTLAALKAMGASFSRTDAGIDIEGEGLVDAQAMLETLRGGLDLIEATVEAVKATQVHLSDGRILYADKVVIAAGFESRTLADDVPSLKALSPVKGHIIDVPAQGQAGVVRAGYGYRAQTGARLRVGATMQPGQSDQDIEPDRVADLIKAGEKLGVDMSRGTPLTGVRAATPDGWPLIGQDAASGVWVATGMRRNGFIFAPYAAKVLLAAWAGQPLREAAPYDPNRFLKRN